MHGILLKCIGCASESEGFKFSNTFGSIWTLAIRLSRVTNIQYVTVLHGQGLRQRRQAWESWCLNSMNRVDVRASLSRLLASQLFNVFFVPALVNGSCFLSKWSSADFNRAAGYVFICLPQALRLLTESRPQFCFPVAVRSPFPHESMMWRAWTFLGEAKAKRSLVGHAFVDASRVHYLHQFPYFSWSNYSSMISM